VRGLHALQIEINRALYVDEATLDKRDDFPLVAAALSTFMRQMADFVLDFSGSSKALAAE
jgi:N-formylglutamate amidohydrolase